jgi:hypothetical protein
MPSSSWRFARAARAGLVDIHRLLVFPMVVGGGKQLCADGASSSGFRPLPTPAAVLGSFWIIKAADLGRSAPVGTRGLKAGAGCVRSRTSLRSRPDTGCRAHAHAPTREGPGRASPQWRAEHAGVVAAALLGPPAADWGLSLATHKLCADHERLG